MDACLDILGYVDLQEVGVGGFGRVYRARQPSFDRTVAIKLLNGRLDDEATVRRFQRECRALGSVSSHPNIVPMYDAGGTPAGQPYLVMDFIGGGSLADRLARYGPLPWTEVAAIGVKISGALHSAHLAGVLHRDIKPENILVSGYGEPLLADFGIAQRGGIENRTTTAASLTPSHAAPEQFSGAPPSQATDVYALASTLFTLVAGHPPFRGRPDESVFAMIARAATEPVPDLRPRGVPEALVRVIELGLDKDPVTRPGTALALGRLLQDAERALGGAITALPVEQEGASRAPTGEAPAFGAAAGRPAVPAGATPNPAHYITPGNTPTRGPGLYGGPNTGPNGGPNTGPNGGPNTGPNTGPGPRGNLWSRWSRRPWILAGVIGFAVLLLVGFSTVVLAVLGVLVAADEDSDSSSGRSGYRASSSADDPTADDPASTADEGTTQGTAAGGTLDTALLLTPGQAPLTDWTDLGATDLLGDPGTSYLCDKTVDLAGGTQGSVLMVKASANRTLIEQVFRVGAARATKAMKQLRDSGAACTTFDAGLAGQATIVPAPTDQAKVADDSAVYEVKSGLASLYSIYFRRGGDFCAITLTVNAGALQDADRALAAKAAAEAAKRLGGG